MIWDTIEQLASYKGLDANLDRAIDHALRVDLAGLPLGRHEIDGTTIFAISERYTTKDPAEAKLEAHRRYADIQLILGGRERMGIAPLASVVEAEPYDADRDVAFYKGEFVWMPFDAGTCAIYLPQDAHAPGLSPEDGPNEVRKVVLKVLLED